MHAAQAGVWEMDPVSRLVTASPEAQRLFRLDEQAEPRPLRDYLDPLTDADRDGVLEELSRATVRGNQFCFSAHLRKDQTLLVCRGGVVRDPASGSAVAMHGVVMAGAPPGSAEAQHRKFRFHIENTPLAVIEFARGDTIVSWSHRAEEIFGWTAEEVLGKHIADIGIVYEEDRERVASLLEDMTAGQKALNVNYNRNRRRDGTVIHCAWHNSVLTDEDGKLDSVVSLVLDVTDRVRSREEIDRLHLELSLRFEELEKIINIAPVGLGICTDGTGNHIHGNRYLAQLLGIPPTWNLSKTGTDDQDPGYRVYQDARELSGDELPMQIAARFGKNIHDMEFQVVRADGRRIHLLASAAPLTDVAGNVRGAVGCFVDITERTRLQNELRAFNADLMQFIWAVNHDLQEPLRMIRSFSQLLQRRHSGQLDQAGREYLDFVLQGSQRMDSMLRDLLEYTRAGAEPMAEVICDANEAGQIARENLSALIAQKSAQVTVDPLPIVAIPKVHLIQLLQNLIGNALKYSRTNVPPVVHVSVAPRGAEYEFCVRDNGIGIDPAYHDFIFGMFHRMNTIEAEGTGLGLALCRRIVERHGGKMRVESAVGQGSAFFFTLCSGSHGTADSDIAGGGQSG